MFQARILAFALSLDEITVVVFVLRLSQRCASLMLGCFDNEGGFSTILLLLAVQVLVKFTYAPRGKHFSPI